MTEINKNIKLDNFRYRLGRLQHTFDSYANPNLVDEKFFHHIFTPKWVYESQNEFVQVILNELESSEYDNKAGVKETYNDYSYDILDYISGKESRTIYSKIINKRPKKTYSISDLRSLSLQYNGVYSYELVERWKLIYWWLVIVALDTDLYTKYLDYIVDVADMFDFTEDMMHDWCEAVIYWLNGNDINPNCDLKLRTDEAKCFFLNKHLGKFSNEYIPF